MDIEIKSHSFTNIHDFGFTQPKANEAFIFELELDIGACGQESSDRFSIIICNEEGLSSLYNKSLETFGYFEIAHLMIFKAFDEDRILGLLTDKVESIKGKTWGEICTKLCVFLDYEFNPNIPDWGK